MHEGEFGPVHRMLNKSLNKMCVVKFLYMSTGVSLAEIVRLKVHAETKIPNKNSYHPNVVQYTNVLGGVNRLYLVMPLVVSTPLSSII